MNKNYFKKSLIAIGLTSILIYLASISIFATPSGFLPYAESLSSKGYIIKQHSEGGYNLNDKATRQEVAGIALKIKGVTLPSNYSCKGYFTDVSVNSPSSWSCRAAELSADNNIVSKSNTEFRPKDKITRSEALAMILKSVGIAVEKGKIASFNDTPIEWQKDISNTALNKKIISSNKSFRPKADITRGELFVFAANAISLSANNDSKNSVIPSSSSLSIPYYFIAIHNEPLPDLSRTDMPTLEESYVTLKRIIAKADEYNIKLTLMFTAQWSDYIEESSARIAELESWKKSGHEIAAHHHGTNHALWDGYTNKTKEDVSVIRNSMKKNENYIGNIDIYTQKLLKLNGSIESGCMSGDMDTDNMPSEIIYTTCTGKPTNNLMKPPYISDENTLQGRNDFMISYNLSGITRYGISHAQITNDAKLSEAEDIIEAMNSGVYGAVAHSIDNNNATGNHNEADSIIKYMDYLHSKDPTGKNSRTVAEVIEQKILPENKISADELSGITAGQNMTIKGKCGDGICGPAEAANSYLCPIDCSGK